MPNRSASARIMRTGAGVRPMGLSKLRPSAEPAQPGCASRDRQTPGPIPPASKATIALSSTAIVQANTASMVRWAKRRASATIAESGGLGGVYGLAGRTAEAQQLLKEFEARRRVTYVPPSFIAYIHRGMGALDQALEWMARGIEERDLNLVATLKTGPGCDPLRSHPTFQALPRKMNLQS